MIEINHLTKKYGNHVAVDDVSLNIESGKIYGFLGPNGAGKSTTMNMITGYLGPTSGEIKINGFDILANPEEAKRCIGYLPEIPPLYLDMTVGEYLRFAAELKKIPKAERKKQVEEAMDLTKTKEMEHRLIKNLSKGYRQRVGLAQAVLGYPEVIILDEPTVGLDPKQIIEIRELIKALGKKHTVILSSHILTEISAVCDHIFIISHGKLVASDTTENLISATKGGQQLSLLVKGNEADTKSLLARTAGISKSTVQAAEEDGCVNVHINAKAGKDLREDIFYAFANAKLPLLELKVVSSSLEDAFLKLTNQNGETNILEQLMQGDTPKQSEEQVTLQKEQPEASEADEKGEQ